METITEIWSPLQILGAHCSFRKPIAEMGSPLQKLGAHCSRIIVNNSKLANIKGANFFLTIKDLTSTLSAILQLVFFDESI